MTKINCFGLIACHLCLKTFCIFKEMASVKIDSDFNGHCFKGLDAVNEISTPCVAVSQNGLRQSCDSRHLVLCATPPTARTCS